MLKRIIKFLSESVGDLVLIAGLCLQAFGINELLGPGWMAVVAGTELILIAIFGAKHAAR